MRDSSGTYVLTDSGRTKLHSAIVNPMGERLYVNSVTCIDGRTLKKICGGRPTRLSSIQALFVALKLNLADVDYEEAPCQPALPIVGAPLGGSEHDSALYAEAGGTCAAVAAEGTPLARKSRRTRTLALAVGAVVCLEFACLVAWWKISHGGTIRGLVARRAGLRTQVTTDCKTEDSCLQLADEANREWYGPNEQTWVDRLTKLEPDTQRSLGSLRSHDLAGQLRLASDLSRYWYLRGDLHRNRRWLEPAENKLVTLPDDIRARALAGLAFADVEAYDQKGDKGIARRGLSASLLAAALARRAHAYPVEGTALRMAGVFEHAVFSMREAVAAFDSAQKVFEVCGDDRGVAMVHYNRSICGLRLNDPEGSYIDMASESSLALAMFRRIGNNWGVGESSHYLREAGRYLPRTADTRHLVEEVEAECKQEIDESFRHPDPRRQHQAFAQLGRMAYYQHRWDVVRECLLGLFQSDIGTYSDCSRAVVLGACKQHCRGLSRYLLLPDEKNFSNETGLAARARIARWIRAGARLSLQDAFIVAADPPDPRSVAMIAKIQANGG